MSKTAAQPLPIRFCFLEARRNRRDNRFFHPKAAMMEEWQAGGAS